MFSSLSKTEITIFVTFHLWSANAFNLVWSKILSCGNGLSAYISYRHLSSTALTHGYKHWFVLERDKLIVFYSNLRENILKTAKALVEDTKTLVAGAASNQEQLANAAQMAVKTITRLADVVKFGAGSLGSDQSEAQVGFQTFSHSPYVFLCPHIERSEAYCFTLSVCLSVHLSKTQCKNLTFPCYMVTP